MALLKNKRTIWRSFNLCQGKGTPTQKLGDPIKTERVVTVQ
jgi:hypothetical protein